MPTAIHRRVDALRAGLDPTFVARLASGWAVMGDPQVLPGYCLLLPDPVASHLNDLDVVAQSRFLADMATLGGAVLAATGALRINYAMFGNLEPALHAHVFPRYRDEPPQLLAGMQHFPFRHALPRQLCLDGKPGMTQQIPQLTQHHAIGLVGTAGQFPQGLAAAGHGEFLHEVHHIRQVQVGGLPATQGIIDAA